MMARGSDKSGKGGIGREDFLLWKAFTKDIEPIHETDWDKDTAFPEERSDEKLVRSKAVKPFLPDAVPPKSSFATQEPQLDGNTDRRLRRGQIPIDGRLDLHGYNQEQAHDMLRQFVQSAYAQNKRCLLVITGKGGGRIGRLFGGDSSGGVLKQKLPQWISDYPLKDIVLKAVHAAPKDGGSGAFYLYLKRKRETL